MSSDAAAFPVVFTVGVPFPTTRLASVAFSTLSVDQELSPLVRRDLELVARDPGRDKTVLQATYRASTNRMLRVAVNGFFESLSLVVQVMQELDADVLHHEGLEDLDRVQGVTQP